MDGFDLLKEAFNKFKDKLDAEDLTSRAMRSVGHGGKALVTKALEEFPQSFVKGMVSDFYAFIGSQEIADGISMTARSFDEEKVRDLLDNVVAQLKDDKTSLQIAKQLRDALKQASNEDLENAIDAMLGDRSITERMIFKAFFEQAKPILEELRNGDEAEIAEKIKELADTIPTDIIAMQVAAVTQEITPERVSKQAHDLVGQLPSPNAISDIVQKLGEAKADMFDKISKAAKIDEALEAVEDFTDKAAGIVADTVANDKSSKTKYDRKKGGSFDL